MLSATGKEYLVKIGQKGKIQWNLSKKSAIPGEGFWDFLMGFIGFIGAENGVLRIFCVSFGANFSLQNCGSQSWSQNNTYQCTVGLKTGPGKIWNKIGVKIFDPRLGSELGRPGLDRTTWIPRQRQQCGPDGQDSWLRWAILVAPMGNTRGPDGLGSLCACSTLSGLDSGKQMAGNPCARSTQWPGRLAVSVLVALSGLEGWHTKTWTQMPRSRLVSLDTYLGRGRTPQPTAAAPHHTLDF